MLSKSRSIRWAALLGLVVIASLGVWYLLTGWGRDHPGQSWLKY